MVDVAELFKAGDNALTQLNGDGDFRSPECVNLLDEADIVVTNPPFSLFREFVSLIVEHQKNFVIIGNQNAISYEETFSLMKNNKMWIGASIHSGDRAFFVPDDYPLDAAGCGIDEETGRKYKMECYTHSSNHVSQSRELWHCKPSASESYRF